MSAPVRLYEDDEPVLLAPEPDAPVLTEAEVLADMREARLPAGRSAPGTSRRWPGRPAAPPASPATPDHPAGTPTPNPTHPGPTRPHHRTRSASEPRQSGSVKPSCEAVNPRRA